jgi:hypothetical protein
VFEVARIALRHLVAAAAELLGGIAAVDETRVDEEGEGGKGLQGWMFLLQRPQFRELGQPAEAFQSVIRQMQQRVLGLTEGRLWIEHLRLQGVWSVHLNEVEGVEDDSLEHVLVENFCLGGDTPAVGGCAQRANAAQIRERHLDGVDALALAMRVLVVRDDEALHRVQSVEQRLLESCGAHIVEAARDHHLLDGSEMLVDAAAHERLMEHELLSRRRTQLTQLRGQLLDGLRSADTYAGQSA